MRTHLGPEQQRRLRTLPPSRPTRPVSSLPAAESRGLATLVLLMLPGVVLAGVLAARGTIR